MSETLHYILGQKAEQREFLNTHMCLHEEASLLLGGVVQLRVCIADLPTPDEQLEPVRDTGLEQRMRNKEQESRSEKKDARSMKNEFYEDLDGKL